MSAVSYTQTYTVPAELLAEPIPRETALDRLVSKLIDCPLFQSQRTEIAQWKQTVDKLQNSKAIADALCHLSYYVVQPRLFSATCKTDSDALMALQDEVLALIKQHLLGQEDPESYLEKCCEVELKVEALAHQRRLASEKMQAIQEAANTVNEKARRAYEGLKARLAFVLAQQEQADSQQHQQIQTLLEELSSQFAQLSQQGERLAAGGKKLREIQLKSQKSAKEAQECLSSL